MDMVHNGTSRHTGPGTQWDSYTAKFPLLFSDVQLSMDVLRIRQNTKRISGPTPGWMTHVTGPSVCLYKIIIYLEELSHSWYF